MITYTKRVSAVYNLKAAKYGMLRRHFLKLGEKNEFSKELEVKEAIRTVRDPATQRDLISTGSAQVCEDKLTSSSNLIT